jgi:hypothetical protein
MKIIHDYNETNLTDVLEVVAATYIGDYAIRIFFNNETERLVDFKPFLIKSMHPSVSKYLDENIFKQFKISEGNLNWNDYDLIFPIHDLYEGLIE